MKKLCVIIIALAWWSWHAIALPNEISYDIQARLDTHAHKIFGTERILFTNRAEKPLTELYLHLWPNRFAEGSVQAREMGADSFDRLFPNGPDYGYLFVQELTLDGKEPKYSIDDTILKIELETPIAPDQTVEIRVKFIVKIPNALERLGHDQGNYYISWWYPKLSVYDKKGWHPDVAHAFGASEPYEDFAHYSVELTVPSTMVVGATGQLAREIVNPDGTKTLTYIAENVHDFAWVADARYLDGDRPVGGRHDRLAVFSRRRRRGQARRALCQRRPRIFQQTLWTLSLLKLYGRRDPRPRLRDGVPSDHPAELYALSLSRNFLLFSTASRPMRQPTNGSTGCL
jgi:hypothetical protein